MLLSAQYGRSRSGCRRASSGSSSRLHLMIGRLSSPPYIRPITPRAALLGRWPASRHLHLDAARRSKCHEPIIGIPCFAIILVSGFRRLAAIRKGIPAGWSDRSRNCDRLGCHLVGLTTAG